MKHTAAKSVLALALGAVVVGCASQAPTLGDQMKGYAQDSSELAKQWNKGHALIKEGNSQIKKGEKLIKTGNSNIKKGELLIERSEASFKIRYPNAELMTPSGN